MKPALIYLEQGNYPTNLYCIVYYFKLYGIVTCFKIYLLQFVDLGS